MSTRSDLFQGYKLDYYQKIKHWQSPTPNINKEEKRDSQNLSPEVTKAAKMLRFKQSFPTRQTSEKEGCPHHLIPGSIQKIWMGKEV